jgi:hypothetical protein
MTTFRCELLAATLAAAAGFAAPTSAQIWPDPKACGNIDPSTQRECISRRIAAKERELDRLYLAALTSVRAGFAKWGQNDNRMHPRYFMQAQTDWKRFVRSNCTATSAFGGGSNSSISDRYGACYEHQLDQRIELFKQVAEGTYGI